MNHIKNLAGQTFVYGLSTIVSRFLNLILSLFYTYIFKPELFGDVTILYSYVAFLNIILTYGMETGFFFFAKKESDFAKVYGSAFLSILLTTLLFVSVSLFFLPEIAGLLNYGNNIRYIFWFILILGIDTLTAIPFAKLRQKNKAFRFAFIMFLNVLVTILFNILLLWVIPHFFVNNGKFLGFAYKLDVELIFIANFIGSLFTLLFLLPDLFNERIGFSFNMWKRMINYSYPLLFAGLIGTINEMLDRVFLQNFLPKGVNYKAEIGIYGGCIKIALFMLIFTQMFRFAAEPFFFGRHKNDDQKTVLADVSKYFFIYGLIIFIGVMAYIDILKYAISPVYHIGLKVVPVYLIGSFMLGVYFNLSFWYKLNGRTYFSIIITGIGAIITVVLNILLIPHFSYLGSAWTRLICYVVITVISYYLGQKYYPVNYPVKSLALYFVLALIAFVLCTDLTFSNTILNIFKNTLIFVSFIAYLERKEKIISLFITPTK